MRCEVAREAKYQLGAYHREPQVRKSGAKDGVVRSDDDAADDSDGGLRWLSSPRRKSQSHTRLTLSETVSWHRGGARVVSSFGCCCCVIAAG